MRISIQKDDGTEIGHYEVKDKEATPQGILPAVYSALGEKGVIPFDKGVQAGMLASLTREMVPALKEFTYEGPVYLSGGAAGATPLFSVSSNSFDVSTMLALVDDINKVLADRKADSAKWECYAGLKVRGSKKAFRVFSTYSWSAGCLEIQIPDEAKRILLNAGKNKKEYLLEVSIYIPMEHLARG